MATCITLPDGTQCLAPSEWTDCSPWDLTEQGEMQCYVDILQQQALDVAGAKINIFKLLGVQEQTKLLDTTGSGNAISGGDWVGFPAANAFTTLANEWRSKQVGLSAVLASAYIGYDFGVIKIPNGSRRRYGIDASVRHHITTIKIKQSSNPAYRITKARIERSENGTQWYGVAVIDLPNDDKLNTIHFKHSVSNRYWRLRPLAFVGGICDAWGVQALELHDFMASAQDNIQDKIWLENRNRDYAPPVQIKGYYDLLATELDLTKFMAELGETSTYRIKLNFSRCIAILGRPVIIGDYIELPSEQQYTPTLAIRKKFLEVTDVTWDPDTYTPGWHPTMLSITAKPGIASEETQQIFGDLAAKTDDSGLFDNDDGLNTRFQDYSTVEQTIDQEAKNKLPERGAEGSSTFREFSEEELALADAEQLGHIRRLNFNKTGLYVEDAMPQNNAPFTEGPTFPTNPANGDYHRLTFVGLARDVPARLYRWSTVKGRWIFLEKDRRAEFNDQKAVLEDYLTSSTRKPGEDIK